MRRDFSRSRVHKTREKYIYIHNYSDYFKLKPFVFFLVLQRAPKSATIDAGYSVYSVFIKLVTQNSWKILTSSIERMRNPFFPLSDNVFAGGTKSTRGGPNPLADFVRGDLAVTLPESEYTVGHKRTQLPPIPCILISESPKRMHPKQINHVKAHVKIRNAV